MCITDGIEASFAELRATDFYGASGEAPAQFFERHFPDRNDVHRLLMEPISYANGSTLAAPALSYRIAFRTFMSKGCLLYTSPSPRDRTRSRMQSSA